MSEGKSPDLRCPTPGLAIAQDEKRAGTVCRRSLRTGKTVAVAKN